MPASSPPSARSGSLRSPRASVSPSGWAATRRAPSGASPSWATAGTPPSRRPTRSPATWSASAPSARRPTARSTISRSRSAWGSRSATGRAAPTASRSRAHPSRSSTTSGAIASWASAPSSSRPAIEISTTWCPSSSASRARSAPRSPPPPGDHDMSTANDIEVQSTELLRTLIRNACVNTGEEASGHEDRSCDALETFFRGSGLSCERYTSSPGRMSLITRIQGSDPKAPTLLLMGHTDVVPVSPSGWRRDPFAGDLVDGIVWGRGAIDMLNLTATMAVATRRLATSGWKPKGTLIYLAVADEEAGGVYGAEHLVEHEPDAGKCDYVIPESGGVPIPTSSGYKLRVSVGEKGGNWRLLTVHGTPGHGSRPVPPAKALGHRADALRRSHRPRAGVEGRPRHGQRDARPRGACLHPHHVLAQRGARRQQGERDPGTGRDRGGHPRADRRTGGHG